MSVFQTRGLAVLALLFPALASAQVSITSSGAVEGFDTLAVSGTSNVLPEGWALFESDDNANDNYAAGDGSGNAGNTYSFGTGTDTERAFGMLLSGSLVPTIGAQLQNDTGGTLTQLPIAYIGEQWRLGATARVDRLDFQYSLDATGLDNGTWNDIDSLDFVAPVTAGAVGGLNGNLAANSVAVEGAIGGLSLAPGATLWIRWVDLNASGADDGLAIDDVVFGTAEDVAPILANSVPVNGAANFSASANLTLQFSEAVTTTGNWFTLSCGGGALPVTVSGGPTSYVLNPDANLPIGANCTLSLNPALIADQDGKVADLYAGITTIAFATVAPPANVPPAVTATQPLDGSTTFPSAGDLGVTFSEAVTLSPGAFALSCAQTSGIVLVHITSGTTFSIDTGTALVAGEACTFAIDADAVSDSEGAHPAADTLIDFTVSTSSTSGYYATVNASSPGQLRCTLHNIIDGHTAYPYTSSSTDTWDILNLADEDPADPGKVLDIYRNESYTKISGGTGAYNREHTWPNSLGFPGGSPGAYTDTHMLYASNVSYNSTRNNSPYDNCPGCSEQTTLFNHGVGGGSGVYPGNSNWYTGDTYEVWKGRKGDAARAIMYMAIRYEGDGGGEPQLELTNNRALIQTMTSTGAGNPAYMGILSTLIAWHQADPPDAGELLRNEVVYGFQGNRNPFIDHPEWGTEALFTSTNPAVCEIGTGNLPPVANDDTYNATEDTALAVTAPGVLVNDTDAEAAALTAVPAGNVAHGTLQLVANGGFTYTPAAGYCGTDGFTYRASDGSATSALAVVTLDIACVNDAPVAANDTFGLPENSAVGTVVGSVSANDPDAGDVLTYQIVAGNTGNAFVLDGSGQVTVQTAAAVDFETTPQFQLTVRVSDDAMTPANDEATITIDLDDVSEPAVANNDDAGLAEDAGATALGVLDNDAASLDDGQLQVIAAGTPAHGSVSFDANDVYYTAAPDYCGPDSVTYTVNGNDTATVTIDVTCVNDAPVMGDLTLGIAENSGNGSIVGTVPAGDPDVGDVLSYTITAGNDGNAFAIDGSGQITVQNAAALDFEVSPQFVLTVAVSDDATPTPAGDAAEVRIHLTNVSEPAVAHDDAVQVGEDAVATALDVRGNDAVGEDGLVVISSVGTASHGSVTFDSDDVYYSPGADYCGSDSVGYTLQGGSSATVTIDVVCVNDAPVAIGTLVDREAQEGIAIVAFSVAGGFDDVDADDTLAFSQTGLPDGLVLDPVSGTVSGTPAVGSAAGSVYTVVVTAGDGEASVQEAFEYTVAPATPLPDALFADGFED